MMLGRRSFPIGFWYLFRGELLNFGRLALSFFSLRSLHLGPLFLGRLSLRCCRGPWPPPPFSLQEFVSPWRGSTATVHCRLTKCKQFSYPNITGFFRIFPHPLTRTNRWNVHPSCLPCCFGSFRLTPIIIIVVHVNELILEFTKITQITRKFPRLKRLRFYLLVEIYEENPPFFFGVFHGPETLGPARGRRHFWMGRFNYPTLDSHVFFEHLDSM